MPYHEALRLGTDSLAKLVTGFNLVSTFTFYLAISRNFRAQFLNVMLFRKAT